MADKRAKILIIRFSSFGDVTQTLSVATKLSEIKNSEIHWCVRTDLAELLKNHPHIFKIWPLERREGIKGLIKIAWLLRKEKFTHIYDAHSSLRSQIITLILSPWLQPSRLLSFPWPKFLRKSQKRFKRFLLFQFRINLYEKPFSGQRDLLEPLVAWGLNNKSPSTPQIFPGETEFKIIQEELNKLNLSSYVALCPSAAHKLKRWPIDHWKKLIELLPQENFVLLGGFHDAFVSDLVQVDPNRVFNFAGRLSLLESAALLAKAKLNISNDTGPLHLSEQLGKPAIALMGPAPFGFPSRPSTKILELDLKCRPCSKHGQGPCTNPKYHQCLVDISPEEVATRATEILLNSGSVNTSY